MAFLIVACSNHQPVEPSSDGSPAAGDSGTSPVASGGSTPSSDTKAGASGDDRTDAEGGRLPSGGMQGGNEQGGRSSGGTGGTNPREPVATGPAGQLDLTISGTRRGVDYACVNVVGKARLGGTLALTFAPNFTPKTGDRFQVLTASGGVSGTFARVTTNAVSVKTETGANEVVVVVQ